MMDIIYGYLSQSVSVVLPFVILLGLLIFVHELGHFWVAKYYGVRVEVFSLGFGYKILKYRPGETEYCLSLIPLGGYVKMYGDDPNSEIPDAEKHRSFLHKPVGQRIAVVLAGPLMNFFFAIFLFSTIATIGEDSIAPVLGDVPSKSQAFQFGFRSGDTISSIDGQAVRSWEDVQTFVENHPAKSVVFGVKHQGEESVVEIQAQTQDVPNKNVLSVRSNAGEIEGLTHVSMAAFVGVRDLESVVSKAGLKTGDLVKKVNGVEIQSWNQLVFVLSKELSMRTSGAQVNDPIVLSVERSVAASEGKEKEKVETLDVRFEIGRFDEIQTAEKSEDVLARIGLLRPDLFVSSVVPDSPAAAAGLQIGDQVNSANGNKVSEWSDLVAIVRGFNVDSSPLNIQINRAGDVKTFLMTPKLTSQVTATGHEEQVYTIGISPRIGPAALKMTKVKTEGLIPILIRGVRLSWEWTGSTLLGFVRLAQNKVSAKSIGGPIMIGQLASRTFEIGMSAFLKIMAIISINLFVLNLLPIPVLDGGHLLFYLIEVVRGAPLSLKKIQMAQQVGLALLMVLMVFALFNDVTRLFS